MGPSVATHRWSEEAQAPTRSPHAQQLSPDPRRLLRRRGQPFGEGVIVRALSPQQRFLHGRPLLDEAAPRGRAAVVRSAAGVSRLEHLADPAAPPPGRDWLRGGPAEPAPANQAAASRGCSDAERRRRRNFLGAGSGIRCPVQGAAPGRGRRTFPGRARASCVPGGPRVSPRMGPCIQGKRLDSMRPGGRATADSPGPRRGSELGTSTLGPSACRLRETSPERPSDSPRSHSERVSRIKGRQGAPPGARLQRPSRRRPAPPLP